MQKGVALKKNMPQSVLKSWVKLLLNLTLFYICYTKAVQKYLMTFDLNVIFIPYTSKQVVGPLHELFFECSCLRNIFHIPGTLSSNWDVKNVLQDPGRYQCRICFKIISKKRESLKLAVYYTVDSIWFEWSTEMYPTLCSTIKTVFRIVQWRTVHRPTLVRYCLPVNPHWQKG